MTFKRFNDSKRILGRSQYFDILEGKKISATLPRSWKKSFNKGFAIPVKMRRCNNCSGEILCDEFNNQINENKEFEAQLNELKRHSPKKWAICFLIINYKLYDIYIENNSRVCNY